MSKNEPRWYGVSTGDGNNGVSHMFPDYYVFTDDPWELAERAAQSDLKEEYHDQIELREDGSGEGASAEVYTGEVEYCDFILEVFPLDADELENGSPREGFTVGDTTSNGRAPMYGSISEALGEESVA